MNTAHEIYKFRSIQVYLASVSLTSEYYLLVLTPDIMSRGGFYIIRSPRQHTTKFVYFACYTSTSFYECLMLLTSNSYLYCILVCYQTQLLPHSAALHRYKHSFCHAKISSSYLHNVTLSPAKSSDIRKGPFELVRVRRFLIRIVRHNDFNVRRPSGLRKRDKVKESRNENSRIQQHCERHRRRPRKVPNINNT